MTEDSYEYSYTHFQEPWWLDIVAPGQWREAIVEKGGHLIGRLPYIVTKRRPWITVNDHPPFTNTLGPWIAPPKGKYSKQLSTYSETMKELVSQLPKVDYFEQCMHYCLQNWLPFYWDDYSQFLSYTLIVKDLSSPEAVWDQMQPRIRNNVRKAEDRLEIRDDLEIEVLIDIIKKTYEYRNSSEKFSEEILKDVVAETRRRKQGMCLFAVDGNSDVRAASFITYDQRSAHFILNGVDRSFKDSQVNSFIIWEGIKRCCGKTDEFNFHGNIHPDVFHYFLKFGAHLQPFIQLRKSSRRMNMCNFIHRVGRKLRLSR